MLKFKVDQESCTRCGECVADCPAGIISMGAGVPAISVENEPLCYRCQHCFAICPTGAVSIFGKDPAQSLAVSGDRIDHVVMETLMKGRRAVRRYREENLEPAVLAKLLDVACHAPTGRNCRQVRFTVVDDREKLVRLRDEMMEGLVRMKREGKIGGPMAFYSDLITQWEEERVDFLFRGAPHLLVASAPRSVVTPEQDCMIALSYFDIYAQSQGIGTLWDGLAKITINDLLPEFKGRLGVPQDHVIGYAMAFGKPAVTYARTTQHGPAQVHIVE